MLENETFFSKSCLVLVAYVFTLRRKEEAIAQCFKLLEKKMRSCTDFSVRRWQWQDQFLQSSPPISTPHKLKLVCLLFSVWWQILLFLEAVLCWLALPSSSLSRGGQVTSPAEVLLPSTWAWLDPRSPRACNVSPHSIFHYLALSKGWSKAWGWGEEIPFVLSPWKGTWSSDVFTCLTFLTVPTCLAHEVEGVNNRGIKEEKRKKNDRNGGCRCTCGGGYVFCLFCRVWKRCWCTQALLSSPCSSQTLFLAGCGRNLLQWFPILCWLKTKGWFPLPPAFALLPFLCREGNVSLQYWMYVLLVHACGWMLQAVRGRLVTCVETESFEPYPEF